MPTQTERPATLQVTRATWRRLNLLRMDPRDTFDDIVRRLLDEREGAQASAKESRTA